MKMEREDERRVNESKVRETDEDGKEETTELKATSTDLCTDHSGQRLLL